MDINEKIDYWLELAEYDLSVADSLFLSGKYIYVGFFCHLIIEKSIKAYYWHSIGSEPDYTHNLILLSRKSNLNSFLSEEFSNLLITLMPLNIQARYPTDKKYLMDELTEEKIKPIFEETKRMFEWIKNLIKN